MTKKIVAILGDYYHDAEYSKKSLELAVQQLEGVTLEYITYSNLVDHLQSKPDAVILYADNKINPQDSIVNTWMDMTAANEICNYVNEGGGWIAWHSGLASYNIQQDYTSMIRGYFQHHPPEHITVTYYTDKSNEWLQQDGKIEILDEHYFVFCDSDNTNVFLKSESKLGSSIAGWEHKYGRGQVVCLTPAHFKEGLLDQNIINLLIKSINKCLF
jgi:type 1 glutamine amidotransferase